MQELLRLDWRTRINAFDAMEHPYFKAVPLPAKPHEIPTFEESHELDRRKFHDRKANLPAAPRGGTVGLGPDANGATAGFNSSDGYGGRNGMNGSRHRGPEDRRQGWPPRDRMPPHPPPGDRPPHRDDGDRGHRSRGPQRGGGDVDTYVPQYARENVPRRRDDRPRDEWRPQRDGPREDRRNDPRERRTRSRSRSPQRDRARERERDAYRR